MPTRKYVKFIAIVLVLNFIQAKYSAAQSTPMSSDKLECIAKYRWATELSSINDLVILDDQHPITQARSHDGCTLSFYDKKLYRISVIVDGKTSQSLNPALNNEFGNGTESGNSIIWPEKHNTKIICLYDASRNANYVYTYQPLANEYAEFKKKTSSNTLELIDNNEVLTKENKDLKESLDKKTKEIISITSSFQNQIKELEAKKGDLESRVNELTGKLSSLESTVKNMAEQNTALTRQIESSKTAKVETTTAEARRAEDQPAIQSKSGGKKTSTPQDTDEMLSTGTAWLTTSGYFITNYHVVKGKSQFFIIDSDKNKHQLKAVLKDANNDVAIFELIEPMEQMVGLDISKTESNMGDQVFTIGYPHADLMGLAPKMTDGIISSVYGIQDDPRFYQISVPVQPGNSGGPLLNKAGEVVGIVTLSLNSVAVARTTGSVPQNVNYALKTDYLTPLLKNLKQKQHLPYIKLLNGNISDFNQAIYMVIAQ